MSSIDSLSSPIYVSPSSALQSTQASSQLSSGSDPDGDGDGGQKVKRHGGHGHGQMQAALMQALQSLGLTGGTAGPSAGTPSSSSSQSATDSDGDADGSTSTTGALKSDMRQFMQALFQAVKSEGASATTGTQASNTASGNDPKASFSDGLAALISQVSNGQAPAGLQTAFSKVLTDLQGGSGSAGSGASATASSTQVSLQDLLTKMQQNIGYGPSSSASTLGNLVNAHG